MAEQEGQFKDQFNKEYLQYFSEYCDISKYVCDYYGEADFDLQNELAIGDYTVLLMLYNSKTNKFGLKASGEGEAVIDINFCPKCGRNL